MSNSEQVKAVDHRAGAIHLLDQAQLQVGAHAEVIAAAQVHATLALADEVRALRLTLEAASGSVTGTAAKIAERFFEKGAQS